MFTESKSTEMFLFFFITYRSHVNDQAIHALHLPNLHAAVNHRYQVKNQIPCVRYGDIDRSIVDCAHNCL